MLGVPVLEGLASTAGQPDAVWCFCVGTWVLFHLRKYNRMGSTEDTSSAPLLIIARIMPFATTIFCLFSYAYRHKKRTDGEHGENAAKITRAHRAAPGSTKPAGRSSTVRCAPAAARKPGLYVQMSRGRSESQSRMQCKSGIRGGNSSGDMYDNWFQL